MRQTVEIDLAKLERYKRVYFPNVDLARRVSTIFVADLWLQEIVHGIVPQEVTRVICNLEIEEAAYGVKPAAPFTREPLRGLWHQHYFSARFMPHNLENAWGRGRAFQILAEEILNGAPDEAPTEERLERIASRLVKESLERRADQNQLTGEWIIFLPRQEKNHYLLLEQHTTRDQEIYDRLISSCVFDFPDIESWIAEARSGVSRKRV